MNDKGCFSLFTFRISLFREDSCRTDDMDTIEYATFRYDMVEVGNSLQG